VNDGALDARSRSALAAHGLSLSEHFVMCQVGYRINAGPEVMVRQAVGSCEGDPRGSFTEADYCDALASCIRRGLLKVLEPGDFDDKGRRTYLRAPPLATQEGFEDYAPGHVEFTMEGHRVHQAVVQAIFGDASRR
jgi:GH43 family beta-xylosidase